MKDKECKAAKLTELKARKGCKALKVRGLKGMRDTRSQDFELYPHSLVTLKGPADLAMMAGLDKYLRAGLAVSSDDYLLLAVSC